jgi:hypothetical protein
MYIHSLLAIQPYYAKEGFMNIPTFENVCKYEDADDTFYEAFEMLTELPWLGSFTAAWVAATILSMVQRGEKERKKVRVWLSLPEEDYLIIDFCPMSLTAERHNSDTVDREGFVISDELNEKFVVHGWSNCEYHNHLPPDLEVIEGGVEE